MYVKQLIYLQANGFEWYNKNMFKILVLPARRTSRDNIYINLLNQQVADV